MALKDKLMADKQGEAKAIMDYTARIAQTKGSPLSPKLHEIRSDEKDHHRILTNAIRGLKSATNGIKNGETVS